MIIAGTPKQVIAKLRILLEQTRPGIFAFWGNDGTVSHQDAKTCIRLLGQEVFPAVREMAKEFDLKSPFETNQPVSVDYMSGASSQNGRRRNSGSARAPTSIGGGARMFETAVGLARTGVVYRPIVC